MNIGPRADGTIPEEQLKLLHIMGDWLKINDRAIYGTRYWKVNHQKAGDLVVQTALAAVAGQALYRRVQHFDAGGAKTGLQSLHVRQRAG